MSRLTKEAYQKLIDEDIEWLEKQPNSLEKYHILQILKKVVDYEYNNRSNER